jgi:hypothetical protein
VHATSWQRRVRTTTRCMSTMGRFHVDLCTMVWKVGSDTLCMHSGTTGLAYLVDTRLNIGEYEGETTHMERSVLQRSRHVAQSSTRTRIQIDQA